MPATVTRRAIVLLPLLPFAAAAGTVMAFGAEPAALPRDVEWRITRIGETPTAEVSQPTISFGSDGSFHGRACNTFRGSYEIDGDKLSFGRAAATMMACAEPLMAQENALFSALERVTGFRLMRDGALQVTDEAGNLLIEAHR